MGKQTAKWYGNKIAKYFQEHYGEYEGTTEWFVNPSKNRWKCYIPELKLIVVLSCDDDGVVSEKTLNTNQAFA